MVEKLIDILRKDYIMLKKATNEEILERQKNHFQTQVVGNKQALTSDFYPVTIKTGKAQRVLSPIANTTSGQKIRINAESMNRFFTKEQRLVERYVNEKDNLDWGVVGTQDENGKKYEIKGEIFAFNAKMPDKPNAVWKEIEKGIF